jgi:thiol:disulfide interchange protein
MKHLVVIVIGLLMLMPSKAQQTTAPAIYNPQANAKADLAAALLQAKEQKKQVLIQVGGNWCPWCIRLHNFMHTDQQVDSILKADYVFMLINYSPENKNPEILASLEYPQRFGFPVLLVLDESGKRLHTQDSGLLEQGKGYDPEKVKRFLLSWNRSALDPATYAKK